jgi:hypothetical protein
VRTQHGVPTNHLANMDGLNVRRRQPRLHYVGAKDKFITEHRQHMEEQLEAMGDHIEALISQLSNILVTEKIDKN